MLYGETLVQYLEIGQCYMVRHLLSKKISNDQELIKSDPTSARCSMKYQILKYFSISRSFGRNDWLSGVGVWNFVIKKIDNFRFSCMLYFTILALL